MTESQDPSLPLDLDVPYNDDFNVFVRNNNNFQDNKNQNINTVNNKKEQQQNKKNILISNYNPNSDFNLRNTNNKNKNIIINNFENNKSINNNISRPSHKTHVEIITKNGATKKPTNVIFNNYNPDVISTINNNNNNHHHHPHPHPHNIQLTVRNDINDNNLKTPYERKSTCMLYLQADHTFFQKMGSDEASIEAITRHVQRANTIYKNTGKLKNILLFKMREALIIGKKTGITFNEHNFI